MSTSKTAALILMPTLVRCRKRPCPRVLMTCPHQYLPVSDCTADDLQAPWSKYQWHWPAEPSILVNHTNSTHAYKSSRYIQGNSSSYDFCQQLFEICCTGSGSTWYAKLGQQKHDQAATDEIPHRLVLMLTLTHCIYNGCFFTMVLPVFFVSILACKPWPEIL